LVSFKIPSLKNWLGIFFLSLNCILIAEQSLECGTSVPLYIIFDSI